MEIPYGKAFTCHAPMIVAGAVDFAGSGDWTPATGDVKISKDEGTEANIGTLPTFSNGEWKWTISATEAEAKRIRIRVVDSATKAVGDNAFLFTTFGDNRAHRREPGLLLRTTIATLASQTSFTLTHGPTDDDAFNGLPIVIHDAATALQVARGIVSDYVGSTKTITLKYDPGIYTMAVGDEVDIWVGDLSTAGRTDVGSVGGQAVGLSSDNRLQVDVAEWNDVPLGTTNPLPNAAPDAAGGLPISDAGGLDLDTKLGYLQAAITSTILNRIDENISDAKTLTAAYDAAKTAAQASVCTEARLAELDAANLPTDVAAIPTNPMLATENGSSFTAIPDMATATNQTELLNRLTSARAGYLDNLNVGGAVASQADIDAINQSASRRSILTVLAQWERPESGNFTKTIECRTWDGDGAPANADSTPTIAITGASSGDLSGNLSVASNPATGVYRWTYTDSSSATLEDVRIDVTPTIGGTTYPVAAFAAVVDLVSATWTATDASNLTAIFNKLPSKSYLAGSNNSDGDIEMNESTGDFSATQQTRIQTQAAAALTAYDPPTNAELEARTLVAASYATIANQTAMDTKIDDIPTVAEFEARTLAAADYFDPAADTVANVATVGNVSGNVTGSVGSVLGGINTTAGTITTLDGLDTAQDSQHSTTQAAVSALNNLSSADVASAVWNAATATYGTAGSYGLLVETNLDAAVSSVGGDDAATIWAYATRTVSAATNITSDGAAINATAGVVDRVTLVDTTTTNTDMRGTDSAYTGTPPSAVAIATQVDTTLSGSHGSGSWASSGAGSGARTVTVTVDDGSDPLENVVVRYSEGISTYTATTDANGQATLNLDDATYTVALYKHGYTYAGTTHAISGDATPTYSMSALSITTPASPNLSTGVLLCLDEQGAAESGATINARIKSGPSADGYAYDDTKWSVTSDVNGLAQFVGMVRGATYVVWRGTSERKTIDVVVPNAASFDIDEVIGKG